MKPFTRMIHTGPKRICVEWLRTALSNYVIIDAKKFEASLLASERNMTMDNLELIERKIPLSKNRNSTTFITVSGTISKLTIEWKWTSLLLLEYSRVEIHGVKVMAVLSAEETGSQCIHKEEGTSPMKEEEEKQEDGTYEKRSLLSIATKEYRRLLKSLRDIVPSSEILRRALYHFTNTLSLKFMDVELNVKVCGGQSHTTGDSSPSTLVLGFQFLEFLPTSGTSRRNSTSPPVDTIRYFHIDIGSLYFNVVDRKISLPVLEPFSYAATIRRVYGMRFMDALFGYEIIGTSTDGNDSFSESHGMIVHVGATRIGAVKAALSLFSDRSSEEDLADPLTNKADSINPRKTTRTFSGIVMFIVGIVMMLSFWLAYANVLTAMKSFDEASIAPLMRLSSISFRFVLVGSVCLFLRWSTKLMRILSKAGGLTQEELTNQVAIDKNPAVYRLPLAYLRIIGPKDTRIDFTKIALMGRLDGTVINISADSFDIAEKNTSTGLRVEAHGIRAVINNKGTIANIDSIDDLFIPQTISLTSPIRRTVVRFEDGKAMLKVNSIVGTKVSSVSAFTETSGGVACNDTVANKTRKTVDKDEIRKRIKADIAAETQRLAVVARMFEGIPVKTVTKHLRLYKCAFRGSEGVDYLLELNVASTREDALQIGRSLQIEFNLFEDARQDFFAFQDDYDSVYQFVAETKRRSWDDLFSSVRHSAETFQNDPNHSKLIPFPVTIRIAKLALYEENGDCLVTMISTYMKIKPSSFVSAVDLVTSVDTIENQMLLVTNARLQGYYHPDLPKEIYKMVYSVDSMSATGGFSAKSWLRALGGDVDDIKNDRKKKNKELLTKPQAKVQTGGFALPHVYFAPFTLKLIFRGAIAQARESRMRLNAFKGTETTTSNDLILYFVTVVLARTPGMLKNIDLFGMNLSDLTGIGTGMTVGVKLIPGGQFIGLGVLFGYDIINGAIVAGKKSRGKPDDHYKPGDILRGAAFTVREASRKGAISR